MHSRLLIITDIPGCLNSSEITETLASWFFFNGTMTRKWVSRTPIPRQMLSSRPYAEEVCPPVIPVVSLSEMITVIGLFSLTASSNPVIPEWVNVESPITATDGLNPASDAPLAIVIDAPISTHELMASKGGKAPNV
jgi:hypothetical protein